MCELYTELSVGFPNERDIQDNTIRPVSKDSPHFGDSNNVKITPVAILCVVSTDCPNLHVKPH